MSAPTATTDTSLRLLELIRDRSFLDEPITLSSGKPSNWYIDGKQVTVSPEGAYLIGECFCDELADVEFDAIGGLETGAIPIIASIVSAWHQRGLSKIEGFWVRNAKKEHGTRNLIEGKLEPGSRVVIVDDVVTSGNSVQAAINAVQQAGCTVVKVLAMVDRKEGGEERLSGYGYEWLFSKANFNV